MRTTIYKKYGGRCAYCGAEITLKQMQVNHVKPIFRNWGDSHPFPEHGGADTFDNMMPACAPCNLRKSTLPLETFRAEINLQISRLRRNNASFRLAERFGLIAETGRAVTFWFERCKCGCGQPADWLLRGYSPEGIYEDEPACDSAARYVEECAAEFDCAFSKRPITG